MPVSKYLSPLYKKTYKDIFTELDEVVHTVEVVMDDEQYRIEVLRAHDERQMFSARCWVLKDLTLQPTYPEAGQRKPNPGSMRVFVKHDAFPWVNQRYANGALNQALQFLAQGKKKSLSGR
jgi:hypothetical protein